MHVPFVDLKQQYLSIKQEIDDAVHAVLDQTAFIKGPFVQKFESEYSQHNNNRSVISCANGTDALYIALRALGVGPGDEVVTVANSWISTSETITQTGARVVFVDIDPDDYTIDIDRLKGAITERTKVIIPVHLYGHAARMQAIRDLADESGLKVIEDCAQAHFAHCESGEMVGSLGDIATFSFYPGKNLGAYGDAGAIITGDESLAEKCRMFANHGALVKHEHQIEGINSRLDGLQAAVLSVKLNHIHPWTDQRRQAADLYRQALQGIEQIELPIERPGCKHVYHLFVIRARTGREELQRHLKEAGIDTAVHYPTPLPFLEAYQYLGHTESDFPVCAEYQSQILSLPMFAEITAEQIQHVADSIRSFYA